MPRSQFFDSKIRGQIPYFISDIFTILESRTSSGNCDNILDGISVPGGSEEVDPSRKKAYHELDRRVAMTPHQGDRRNPQQPKGGQKKNLREYLEPQGNGYTSNQFAVIRNLQIRLQSDVCFDGSNEWSLRTQVCYTTNNICTYTYT